MHARPAELGGHAAIYIDRDHADARPERLPSVPGPSLRNRQIQPLGRSGLDRDHLRHVLLGRRVRDREFKPHGPSVTRAGVAHARQEYWLLEFMRPSDAKDSMVRPGISERLSRSSRSSSRFSARSARASAATARASALFERISPRIKPASATPNAPSASSVLDSATRTSVRSSHDVGHGSRLRIAVEYVADRAPAISSELSVAYATELRGVGAPRAGRP